MLRAASALANPHRMRIVAALHAGSRVYVSRLAREIGISRPLVHLHLRKLEDAGLVTSQPEVSRDGKALNYFEVAPFDVSLTPSSVADAARALSDTAGRIED